MTTDYSAQDVTADLAFLMTMTEIYGVDKEGYWIELDTKQRHHYALDNNETPKPIVLFQEPMPQGDYLFFNPFAEGSGRKSPAVQQFYKLLRIALNMRLQYAVIYMLEKLYESKQAAQAGETMPLPPGVARASAVHVEKKTTLYDVVDEKFIRDVHTIFKRLATKIIQLPYQSQMQTTAVTVGPLKDEYFADKYGQDIPKKTILGFKAAIFGVLGVKSVDEIEAIKVRYDPDLKTNAKMYTTIKAYWLLYSRFNDLLLENTERATAERSAVDLGRLEEVLDMMGRAHQIAKHTSQPAASLRIAPTSVHTADTRSYVTTPAGGPRRLGPEVTGVPPFAPPYQPAPAHQTGPRRLGPDVVGAPQGGGYGQQPGYGQHSGYGQYGQGGGLSMTPSYSPPTYGRPAGGLDLTPPNNFGHPSTLRRY